MHKGVFLYENVDTNKMYVCIFKHSFLKWIVGEKITNRLFTGPVTVSHKCKIIDKLQQTKKATSHKITVFLQKRLSLLCVDVLQYFMCVHIILQNINTKQTQPFHKNTDMCYHIFIIQYCQ